MSDVYYPIFETRENVKVDLENGDDQVVGLLAATWFWRDVLKDILPDDSTGIVVVFDNPCNPSFTYMVNGRIPLYLGRGDQHETQYDDLVIQNDFSGLSSPEFSSIPLNENYCPFQISVYPSSEREDVYTTADPIIIMVVTVAIFMFTTLVFVVYDLSVERRQKVVMKTAVTSRAVVSSLYPEVVREQIESASHISGRDLSTKSKRSMEKKGFMGSRRSLFKQGEVDHCLSKERKTVLLR